MYRSFLFGLCLLVSVWGPAVRSQGDPAPYHPPVQYVQVDASAPMEDDSRSARQLAIDSAEVQAVRQVIGRVLNLTEAKRYIKTFRIVDEGIDGQQFHVTLIVTVASEPVAGDQGGLLRGSGSPRIMVVVPENVFQQPHVPDPAGETELIRRLREAQFHVIDASDIASVRYSEDRMMKEADIPAMKALGAKYKCDILITGEAIADDAGRTVGDFCSARARMEIKAFVVDTGEILVSHAVTTGGADLTPIIAAKTALQNAGMLEARYLIPHLRDAVISENRTYTITVANAYNAATVDDLEAEIKRLPGVVSVQRRNYMAETGVVTLEVETALLTNQFSRSLLTLDSPAVAVKSSTGQSLEVGIVGR